MGTERRAQAAVVKRKAPRPERRWPEQYDRMHRSFAEFSIAHTSAVKYEDALRHFMQDCWHLKDWIKNDPRDTRMIAADLANGSKHLRFDKHHPPRVDAGIGEKSVTAKLGHSEPQPVEINCVITTNTGPVVAAEAARNALKAWGDLLAKLRLKP